MQDRTDPPAAAPPPEPQGRVSRLARLSQIAAVMARHGFAPAMRRMPVVRALIPEGADAPSRRPAAERFAAMLEDLGPVFVKLGQILSTRGDLLPPPFIAALARLQDQVPPFPFSQVEGVIAHALGRPSGELFSVIDPTPLASASMAQVHAATTRSGEDVVIKVQRPGIAEQVEGDAELLVLIAELLELTVEEARVSRASDLVREFHEALALELDFNLEAKNLRAFSQRNANRTGLHIPKFHPELSAKTILTMERIHGRRISELVGTKEAKHAVDVLVEAAFDHVFLDGLFHGDPHPGNILVTDKGEIALIDFGLVGRVSRETQDRLLLLMLALSLRDADTLARLLLRLGETDARVEIAAFRVQISRLLERYFGLALGEVSTANVFGDLLELSMRFDVRVPRELAILSKACVALEGVVRSLDPTFDPQDKIAARAEALMLERLDPRHVKGGGLRTALQLGLLIQEVPVQLGQALMDLERGRVQVIVKSEEIEALGRNLRGLGMTIFGGILAGASVFAGFDVLMRSGFPLVRAPVLAGLAFALAGGCFGVSFAWYLTGGRLPRIAMKRLLPGRAGPERRRDAAESRKR